MTATGLPDSTVKGVPMAGPINSGELVAVFLTGARIEHRLALVPLDSLGVPAHWHHVGSHKWWADVQRPEGCTTRHYAKFITGFGQDPAYVPRPERVTAWRLVTDWVPAPEPAEPMADQPDPVTAIEGALRVMDERAPAEHASTESLPAGRLPEHEPEPKPKLGAERPPMVWGIAGKHGWHGAIRTGNV
jgi:hypothetical protein